MEYANNGMEYANDQMSTEWNMRMTSRRRVQTEWSNLQCRN